MFGRREPRGRLMFIFAVALVITVLGIAGAAQAQQAWHFHEDDVSEEAQCPEGTCWEMIRSQAPGNSAEITIAGQDTHYWIANESVEVGSIDFGDNPWTLDILCSADVAVTGTVQLDVRLGVIDAGEFTEIPGAENSVGCEGGELGGSTEASLSLEPSNPMEMETDQYLALEVVNTDSDDIEPIDVFVTIGGAQDGTEYTVLHSHDNDPGYPVWEAASFLLLASGIIGVAGYSRFKA